MKKAKIFYTVFIFVDSGIYELSTTKTYIHTLVYALPHTYEHIVAFTMYIRF